MNIKILILLLAVGLLGLFVTVVPILLIVHYLMNKNYKKRIRYQEAILEANKENLKDYTWFRVRYSSDKKFKKFWKNLLWEGTGVLYINTSKAVCIMKLFSGEELRLEFDTKDTKISWIGKKSTMSHDQQQWFSVDLNNKTYYFTSETGVLVFGSKRTTEDIYRNLININKRS